MKRIIILLLIFGWIYGQSNLGRVDGQLKMQNQLIDALQDSTKALVTIDYAHHEVHDGSSFMYTYADADFDLGDSVIVAFVTPNSTEQLHFVGSAGNSSACTVYLCEAPTITAAKGTNVITYNRNRASADTSSILSSKDSTEQYVTLITAGDQSNNGTVLETYTLGSGKNKIAGATRDFNEWILNEYTKYSFMVIGTANDGILDLRIGWYEHTPTAP